ncbi:MAG: prephenate dehydrogenase [Anaerolineae bacterium]
MVCLKDARVAIVGLGLMGGSLAGALKKRSACREVWGVARREETIKEAMRRGFINVGTCDLAEGVEQADLIVMATPVRTILELIPQAGSLAPAGSLLMDLGSTKARIVKAMEALPPHLQAVGGHPMCGKEASGIEAAGGDLYEGATFVLTPLRRAPGPLALVLDPLSLGQRTKGDKYRAPGTKGSGQALRRTSPEALMLAQELVEAVGAQPLLMDAVRHDRLVAAVSHLPYLLSVGLVATTEEVAAEDELVWELVASGFRDTSRLAASDVTMMLDILLTNRQAVGETLSRFANQLNAISHLLEASDEEGLRSSMEKVRKRREGMFR